MKEIMKKQWEQDVKNDADKAYLRWEFGHIDDECYENATCNADIEDFQQLKEFRRKS